MELRREDIEFIIKQLLYDFDCVIIPGFGGFIARNLPAIADLERGYFAPPKREVGFNSLLQTDDGFLTHAIARKFNLSYSDSRQFLSNYVNNLHNTLKEKQQHTLNELGTFYLDENSKVLFEPNKQINLSKEAYGLTPFSLQPARKHSSPQIIQHREQRLNPYAQPNYVYRNTVRRILSYAAAIAAIGIISFTIKPAARVLSEKAGFDPIRIEYQHSKQESEPEKSITITSEKIETKVQAIEKQESIQQEPTSTIEVPITPVAEPLVEYHIIAGSFEKLANARKFANILQAKGYNSQVLVCESGRIRVSLSHYSSKPDALLELNSLKAEFRNLWIYKL